MAQPYNLVLYQGDDFELVFRLKNKGTGTPVNLTGCVPKADMRLTLTDPVVKMSFTASLLDPLDGTVKLVLSGVQTGSLSAGVPLVYDCQLKWPDATTKTYLSGTINVLPEVTKSA
jgi:hypothetical protein